MMGNTKKQSGPPTGAEHSPDAVRARKRRRAAQLLAALSPSLLGSAAYRRLREQRGGR